MQIVICREFNGVCVAIQSNCHPVLATILEKLFPDMHRLNHRLPSATELLGRPVRFASSLRVAESKIDELAERLIADWTSWEADASQSAQCAQDHDVGEAVLLDHVRRCIRDTLYGEK